MDRIIWYCTEDLNIFPDEDAARKGYQRWICENSTEEFDKKIFYECYKPISYEEYNKMIT